VSDERNSHAPQGASCATHRDRDAVVTCPRCFAHVCFVCWHPAVQRCGKCLELDPTEAAPPIPWDQQDVPLVKRYFGTLATAFAPVRTAPAFARDDVRAALRFMLLTSLPFALLSGIIPHTRTLLFVGNFGVQLVGKPSETAIAFDILGAMGIQLLWSALELGCLLLPFVSLVRAYARPERHAAALRIMYYRSWLLPAATLAFYMAVWALPAAEPTAHPEQAPPLAFVVFALMRILVPVLLFVAMGSTARLACGLGPFMSMVVVMVPVTLWLLVEPLAGMGVDRLRPPMTAPPPASGD